MVLIVSRAIVQSHPREESNVELSGRGGSVSMPVRDFFPGFTEVGRLTMFVGGYFLGLWTDPADQSFIVLGL